VALFAVTAVVVYEALTAFRIYEAVLAVAAFVE
jgi:hypothetical protein